MMTLQQYQRIAGFYSATDDEITQVALIVCDMFNLSHDEVDNMQPKTFIKYSNKVTKKFKKLGKKPYFGRLKLQTDAKKITLGQFIEVQHFLKEGEIDAMHLVTASIWDDSRAHDVKADLLLKKHIRLILADYTAFLQSFEELLQAYKGLFESDEVVEDDGKMEKPHPFIEQYGWIYSAKEVAQFEGITLDMAFDLPILQAFNALAYLKSEQSYQKYINK
jgi:hypothetical protein